MSTVRIPEGVVVWAVLIRERHSDPDVEVWSTREAAEARAWGIARDYAHDDEEVMDVTNDAMRACGWVLELDFSPESDAVSVMKKEIRFAV